MEGVRYDPIGVIRTPFASTNGMPIQAVAAEGERGRIELLPQHRDGLIDLDGFSHLTLIYDLHLSAESTPTVRPFLDDADGRPRGVFATRSPRRPNSIGLSTVRLTSINDLTLHIEDVDMVDGTPLLDIKPYVPTFDDRREARIGWFEGRLERLGEVRADGRFGA